MLFALLLSGVERRVLRLTGRDAIAIGSVQCMGISYADNWTIGMACILRRQKQGNGGGMASHMEHCSLGNQDGKCIIFGSQKLLQVY